MNITKETETFVFENSSIKDSLKNGLINYSKLTRKIISETNLKPKDFDAVLIALRRLEYKLKKNKTFERKIKDVLKNTKLEFRNKVLVCVIESDVFVKSLIELEKEIVDKKGNIQIIQGIFAHTIITTEEFEFIIDKRFKYKIIKKTKSLVEIILRSPESLENVPGVIGYLSSLIADKEINIVEMMSCWTDSIFIFEEKNLEKIIKLFSF